MTFDYCKRFKPFFLCIFVVMLFSVVLPLVAGNFDLDHLEISSDPADGTTYRGDREIASDTKRIKSETWNPVKVPPLITYTISAYAKGPGTLTFYLGTGGSSQDVGSWTSGSPLSDGAGTYEFYTFRPNEDNYDFESNYDAPYDDQCVPYLSKGFQAEVVESTNSTLSIDGGRATFNAIDTHVGGANTTQKTLEASAGWKAAGVDAGYASSSTQSWIYRPSATSLQVPETSLSLSGSFSVDLEDTLVSGSAQNPAPEQCVPCAGCGEYMHSSNEFAHRRQCWAPKHQNDQEVVHYYICVPADVELHKERTCGKIGCGKKYHNCSPDDPICNWWPLDHSDASTASTSDSPGLSPSGGSYAASPGGAHTASLTLPSAYSSIYWYVKSPSESGLGTSVNWVSGDGSSTSATFSYTFASDASGDYVITAYTYLSDNSIVQPSYTVSVGSSDTDITDNTPDCSWCTDGCSACPTSTDDSDDTDSDDESGDSDTQSTCAGCGDTYDSDDAYSHTLFTCKYCAVDFRFCGFDMLCSSSPHGVHSE